MVELKCPKCGCVGFEHFTGRGHWNRAVDSNGQSFIEKGEIKSQLGYVCENFECGYVVEQSSDLYKILEKLRMKGEGEY